MPVSTYTFRSLGADAVVRDYDRIGAAQKRARAPRGGAGAGGGSGGGGTRGLTTEQQAAKAAEKAAAQLRKTEERQAEQAARFKARLRDRHFLSEQRAQERLEKNAQSLKARTAQKTERDRARDHANQKRDAAKLNSEMAAIEHREKAKWARESEKRMSRIKTAASGIGWGVAGGIASAGAMAGGAGLALAGAALRDRSQARDAAVGLAIGGRGAGETLASPDALLKSATRSAISVKGTRTTDLIAGMSRYQAMTGDAAGAEANARTIALGARASGAQETDIAATLATMKEQFKISDPEQQREALSQVLFTGKQGSFELSDASRFYSEMGSAGSRFGLTGMQGLGQLNAMSQVAMSQTGNGAKASTGVQAMMRQFVAKSDDIKSLTGTDVFQDKGKTKANNIEDVIANFIGGAKGNLGTIQSMMGDEGTAGISGFVKAYNEAQGALDKGATATEKRAAGEQAVRALMQQYANSTATASDMIADAAAAGDTASATLTTAWEKISSGVGDALLPAFSKIAEHADSIAEPLTAFAEGVAIATDRLVGLAKKFGFVSEDTETKASATPKRDLFETEEELSRLTAKEQKLGGLTKADRTKKLELQSKKMDLKDQLLKDDPTLLDKPFDMVTDAGYQKGAGPMRIPDAKSPMEKILAGIGLETRQQPQHATTLAEDVNQSGIGGKFLTGFGMMTDNILSGKSPFRTPGADDEDARIEGARRDAAVQTGGGASNIDQLISTLNAQKVTVEIKPIPGFSTTVTQTIGAPK